MLLGKLENCEERLEKYTRNKKPRRKMPNLKLKQKNYHISESLEFVYH